MFREDTACVEKLLLPATVVLKQETVIGRETAPRRISAWNEIRKNRERYLEGACGRFLPDLHHHILGQFSAALLVLAIGFVEAGEDAEGLGGISDEEMDAFRTVSRFSVFEFLPPAELKRGLERGDARLLALVHDYQTGMDPWMNAILADNGMDDGIRYYLRERWAAYRRTISAALAQCGDWQERLNDYSRRQQDTVPPLITPGAAGVDRARSPGTPGGEPRAFTGGAGRTCPLPKGSPRRDVFISYSHEDATVADAICKALEAGGIHCWMAPRDVVPGQHYPSAIIRAIEEAQLVIIIFSSRSNTSAHVIRELSKAISCGIPIIPFRIEDVPLSKDMEYLIGIPHWLDALTPPPDRHIGTLCETVKAMLNTGQRS